MFKCPDCKQKTIAASDKLKTLINKKISCSECRVYLKAPKYSVILALLPPLSSVITKYAYGNYGAGYNALVVLFTALIVCPFLYLLLFDLEVVDE